MKTFHGSSFDFEISTCSLWPNVGAVLCLKATNDLPHCSASVNSMNSSIEFEINEFDWKFNDVLKWMGPFSFIIPAKQNKNEENKMQSKWLTAF